jgi:Family of unknown function (DUF6529)
MTDLRAASDPSTPAVAGRAPRGVVPLVVAAGIGAAVSVGLGVYAKVHDPTGEQIAHYGFPTLLSMKAWLTTGVFLLAIAQALSAAWMYGRLPRVPPAPRWIALAHRWTGTAAFLLVLPVAYHCLWSLGWRDTDTRVMVHGILGCAFFGALTTKLLALRINGLPGWAIPVLGGGLVAIVTGIWLTSSLWFFTNVGFPGL